MMSNNQFKNEMNYKGGLKTLENANRLKELCNRYPGLFTDDEMKLITQSDYIHNVIVQNSTFTASDDIMKMYRHCMNVLCIDIERLFEAMFKGERLSDSIYHMTKILMDNPTLETLLDIKNKSLNEQSQIEVCQPGFGIQYFIELPPYKKCKFLSMIYPTIFPDDIILQTAIEVLEDQTIFKKDPGKEVIINRMDDIINKTYDEHSSSLSDYDDSEDFRLTVKVQFFMVQYASNIIIKEGIFIPTSVLDSTIENIKNELYEAE